MLESWHKCDCDEILMKIFEIFKEGHSVHATKGQGKDHTVD